MSTENHKLTMDQIRALAKLERSMDAGEQPFVILGGFRCAFTANVLETCGVEDGQTITDAIWRALIEASIRVCEAEIAAKEFGKP